MTFELKSLLITFIYLHVIAWIIWSTLCVFFLQCIPTPLAWYAHQLPEWVQKLSVVATYVIEIAIPLFFFMPVRSLRILGFLSQVMKIAYCVQLECVDCRSSTVSVEYIIFIRIKLKVFYLTIWTVILVTSQWKKALIAWLLEPTMEVSLWNKFFL